MENLVLSVTEFITLINQTLEYAYPVVYVEGEVSEFRISKNKWVYFNLKDEESKVQCFASVYNLSTVIEDGMKLRVKGLPRLHNKYGFSINVSSLEPVGEGSLKKAFELLKNKLEREGLFVPERKRPLPTYPETVGIISSEQAAGYADFIKIVNKRWIGVDFKFIDVQVQGEPAVSDIVSAIETFNRLPQLPQVLVIIRGGGSLDDLQAFNTEPVARLISSSRVPILTGVGHEVDVTLADLAADVRASTPSNAAEILVPDMRDVSIQVNSSFAGIRAKFDHRIKELNFKIEHLENTLLRYINNPLERINELNSRLTSGHERMIKYISDQLQNIDNLLNTFNPRAVLKRGYSIVRSNNSLIRSGNNVKVGDELVVELIDAIIKSGVISVTKK